MTDRAITSSCVPFCKGTSKPICRPSLTFISSLPTAPPQASKELAHPKSALAHSLLPYPSCLDQVDRFFRLITRHASLVALAADAPRFATRSPAPTKDNPA
ncbi:hypothetical protein IVA84_32170 [Bradyrhizobium sp. 144]|nr:hypothetical protein [Bradyrhizobium sp. 144]